MGIEVNPRKKKILIVDDEPIVRKTCREILESCGFESLLAANGLEGFKTYRERQQEIGLIISDISMPIMDGLQMVRNIFKMDAHSKVIVMSGYNLAELAPREAERLCSVIEKPFTPVRLIEAVQECIGGGKHQPPTGS